MIGGSCRLSDLRIAALATDNRKHVFPADTAVTGRYSFATAWAIVCKAAIATDAFVIIHGVNAGLITAAISCVFIMLMTEASFYVFVRSWSFGDAYSYEEMWQLLFGPRFVIVPVLLNVMAYVMCTVAGFWEFSVYPPEIIYALWPDAPAIFENTWFLSYATAVIIMIPFLCTTRMGGFAFPAWLSVFALLVSMVCLMIHFVRTYSERSATISSQVVYFSSEFDSIWEIIDDLSLAFFAHPFISPVAREMVNPTRTRIFLMTWWMNGASAIVSCFVPMIGYLFFTGIPDEENIFSYLNPVAPEVLIGKIAVWIISVCSTMLYTFFVSQTIVQAIAGRSSGSFRLSNLMTGLAVCLFSVCMNLFDDVWNLALYQLGSIAFNILAFVLPPIYYLVQFRFRNIKWGAVSVVLLCLGVGLLALSVQAFVRDMIELAHPEGEA
jgi:hypothetical protein